MSGKKRQFLFVALLALSGQALAQTGDPFRDFDQMFEQMRRQMLGAPSGTPTDSLWTQRGGRKQFFQMSPDSSSYFYFHVDTSFGGSGGSTQFFNFRFGGPQGGISGSPDVDQMFRQMEEMQRRMWGGTPLQPRSTEPQEDADGLLPEERIRQQEETTKAQPGTNPAGTPSNPPATPAPAAKPKLRTTRV